MASLLMRDGPLVGRRFAVRTQLVLGRVDADVTIDDPQISRRHALVRPARAGIEIEDLGSLNGTWVNGERITSKRPLAPGDVIRLGDTTAEVEGKQRESVRTVQAPSPDASRSPFSPPRNEEARSPTGDELRTVTALFADIVGSTGLGEKLAPYEAKMLIGEAVTRMSREAERFGGSIQAYMGDGIAAFFGVPVVREDDSERAARAGLAIIEVIREYAVEVESTWGISNFTARVGINTGPVAVGLVGAADPQAVSIGDATNVAARLQSTAEPGTIAVGEATARALIHRFALEPLGERVVKGRAQAVAAWRLVSVSEAVEVQKLAPLIGREEEIGHFRAILDELDTGCGQIILLVGDAGIGKTRLLSELGSLSAGRATWLEGQCLSFGAERLFDPFIRMLRVWIAAEEGEADLSVRAKLRAKLELFPDFDVAGDMPYLARLLDLKLDAETQDRVQSLRPEELSAEIRRSYRSWVRNIAARGAVVIALDDLQFADSSTGKLVGELLDLVDQIPLLLVGALRPDPESRGWGLHVRIHADYPHRAVDLPLHPLPDDVADELLRRLPRSSEVDASSRALIVATAEGNPLYLEELLTGFADGAAEKRGSTWAPTITHRGLLTPTLENLMVSQIDRLAPAARQLAQTAAIVGRRFPRRVLEHLAADEDLSGELVELLRAGVIREARRYPEPEYAFRHGLLREAALSMLPPPRRRELYGAVAAAVERLYAGTIDEYLEILAHYYRRSDELPKALDYLERAAERAASLDAVDQEIELVEVALDVAQRLGGEHPAVERLKRRLDDARAQAQRRSTP